MEFSPDGKCLVSASADRTVRTWDPRRGMLLRVLVGHGAGVMCVFCSPAAAAAVSGCEDGGIRVWDIGVDASKLDRAEGCRGKQIAEVCILLHNRKDRKRVKKQAQFCMP